MRIGLMFLAMVFALATQPASAATPVTELQHLLDNAGYNVGGETGAWTPGTGAALKDFAAHYGIDAGPTDTAPDDAKLASMIAAAKAKLEADHDAYPTQKLPDTYYVGLASQWYFNIHNWGQSALVNRDAKSARVPVKRYFEPIEDDVAKFHAAGVTVMRMQLGIEGALFFDECHYKEDGDLGVFDACYTKAFAKAKAEKWASQTELLNHFADNPVVKLYVDAVEYWNKNGFHVMFVPSDFFNGVGSHFNGSDAGGGDPLFHAALVNDAGFQKFYPRFVAAVVEEIRKRNLTNVSVQTANEPRFCSPGGQPTSGGLKNWQTEERAIFDEVRKVAPRMSLVSAAICTAGDQFFSQGRPYSDLGQVMPIHTGLDDVTYSIHVYSPRTLMLAAAQNAHYKPGTLIHYPYQPIPVSAGTNKEAQFGIGIYNRVKPGPQFIEKMFTDIEAFAKAKAIRVMITEINAPKPNFGLPREDRIALIGDIVTSSKRHNVPIIHFGTLNGWGLSSCPHNPNVPDHRFDPGLLNEIAAGNGVAGSDAASPLEPIEVQCGPEVKIRTTDEIDHNAGPAPQFNSLLSSEIAGASKGADRLNFNMRGRGDHKGVLYVLEFVINQPLSKPQATKLKAMYPAVATDDSYDDDMPRVVIRFIPAGKVYKPVDADCIVANTPPAVSFQAKFLTNHFNDVAGDMVRSGDADSIGNDVLKAFMNGIAGGDFTVGVAAP